MSKPGASHSSGTSSKDDLISVSSGIRREGGASPHQAFVWNVRTCTASEPAASWPARREKLQAAETASARVPTRSAGTEQPVVALKVL